MGTRLSKYFLMAVFFIFLISNNHAYAADYNLMQALIIYIFLNQNEVVIGEKTWVQKVIMPIKPVEQNGTILIPITSVAKIINAQLNVNEDKYQLSKDGKAITFSLGSALATMSGRAVTMPECVQSINGAVVVPLRFTVEAFGYSISWNGKLKRTAVYKSSDALIPSASFRSLKVGLSGSDVVELQARLKSLGYFTSNITGYYGSLTKLAVLKAQRIYGLQADGIAGAKTFASIDPNFRQLYEAIYTVRSGDTLWIIGQRFGITADTIKQFNRLTSTVLYEGQKLSIPGKNIAVTPSRGEDSTFLRNPVYNWPSITYIVQPGDTVNSIAQKFGIPADNILKYNYMDPDDWLDAGDKIAISGYAPRVYTISPWESAAPARVGKLVDWILEGQYILKRGDIFTIVDVVSGKQFQVKMMGGYNHSDVEPLTAADTAVLYEIFGYSWTWSPRAVVIFKEGMNIAGSLSGMPHSFDTIPNNNVQGHYDLYLWNSSPHNTSVSESYLQQHMSMVLKAAGR